MYDVDCFFCGYGITAHREQEKKREQENNCVVFISFLEKKKFYRETSRLSCSFNTDFCEWKIAVYF